MNLLELKHLRMICTIAETGNMTRAAERLCITQSALSQQLKEIEGRLKVDIFYRTRKRMLLTSIGQKLLKTAQQVTETVEDAELAIAKIVSGDRGELKVGTQCLFCFKWLPRAMALFQNKFPNVELEVGPSSNLEQELETQKYNLVITATAPPEGAFEYRPLFSDQLVCILPKDHPLNSRAWVNMEDFAGQNVISHTDRSQNRLYQLFLRPKGIEPKRFMVVGQSNAILEMVAAGFGISVFPGWAVRTLQGYAITVRPITKSGFPVTWRAAFLKNRQIPVFEQEFINIVSKLDFREPAATV